MRNSRTMAALLAVAAFLGTSSGLAAPATAPATKPAATRVVFLLDFSGSAVPHAGAMQREVVAAARQLPPGSAFGVVLCGEGKVIQWQPTLAAAGPAAADKLAEWLDEQSVSGNDATADGLATVERLKPDVVWLCSDGDVPKVDAFVAAAGAAARRGRFRVNAVTTFAATAERRHALARVAEAAGGTCYDAAGRPLTAAEAKPKPAAPPPPMPAAAQKPPTAGSDKPSIFREH